MRLVYVNELGPNYKGDNIYEFIFSDIEDVWGEDWDKEPASGNPTPPLLDFIKKVGVLRNSGIQLNLIQNSDFFSVYDATEDIIALAWEDSESEAVNDSGLDRMVFRYGDTVKQVEDKIYERDIVLTYEKTITHNE
tara:strand:+ start:6341 stop:6748 length:408 start_codon:yes stop_codon:yes gene_type:complete